MEIGQPVEVHTHYTGAWAAGFDVADVVTEGYLVRRRSDGSLLPVVIPDADLRAATHHNER